MSPVDRKNRLAWPQILLVKRLRVLKNRGWRIRQPRLLLRLRPGFPQALAAAAIAGVPTFTLICFGFVSSRFGMCSVSAPF
jgi:hypothetical protein